MLFLLLGLLTWAEAQSICPSQCNCTDTVVDCSHKGLGAFPTELPPSTITLNLRGNSIGRLSIDDVRGLSHLETLIVSENNIRSVEENFLDYLPLLRRISLARNKLRFLPSLAAQNSRLISLDLRHNEIETADVQAFSYLPSLIQLDLAHNRLQSLPQMTFAKNKRLVTLKLHRNPWNCDCRILNIGSLAMGKAKPMEEARCFNPPNLRGKTLSSIKASDVPCAEPIVVEKEFNSILECTATGGGEIHWLFNNIDLDFSSADSYQVTVNGSLIIPKGSPTQGFTCTADYGAVPRRTLRQTSSSGRRPQFTFKPKDSSYREGTAVKLHCEVIGDPRPTIVWYHRRQPIVNSRKHELINANSILKIYPFLENDVGSYTCIASNIHGRIEHTARIHLVSSVPPNIYDGPSPQTVKLGQEVTFACRARGVPRPEITWFYEGSVIPHIKGRFRVSDDGTELTITKVNRQDEGVYSCMAGNSVGAMMADAKLTVEGDFARTVDAFIDDATLRSISTQARDNVNRAVDNTRIQLSQDRVSDPEDLKRLFRFSIPAQAVELSKARDIYEESVRLVHEHIQRGLRLPVDKLAPKNVSYEAVLAPSHVQTLMELSGCQTGQFKSACNDLCFHNKYRSYDGQCNNFEHPMWGVSQMPLLRLLPPIYENGFSTPVGWERGRLYYGYPKPNPRDVSRLLVATESITPHSYLSAMVMQWGQFIDHDLTHTAMALSRQSYSSGAICNKTCENLDPCFNIPLSPSDPKLHTGVHQKYPCIEFERSGAVCGSGETSLIFQRVTYRDQMNIITSYLDGSMIYGSTEVQALELRDLFGDHGLLRFDIVSTGQKPYLPFERDSDMDCKRNFSQENPIRCFLAGDLRANEQLGLTAMHTLFLREHNRIAAKLLELNVNWDGETIFQEARKIVGAIIQHITYSEWLPTVLGKIGYNEMIGDYGGYNPHVDPSISNAFATAAFRFGHTLINPTLFRYDKDFNPIKDGHISLHKAFFAPERLLAEGGIDPLVRGLFASPLKMPMPSQLLNMELTEKLFDRFHEVALDLAVMNIQRGRDHGLPGYTEYRRFCNLSVPQTWDDLAADVPDASVRAKMRSLYGDPANVDLWVGGIAEQRLPDALMGPTFACIIGDQFRRLRDGDRFWYENDGIFTKLQLQQIKKASLARIFCDNGDSIDRVQRNVFFYPGNSTKQYGRCENIPEINLNMWMNCCDTSCSLSSPTSSRKRRAHNSCDVNGERRHHGDHWSEDKCTTCKCDHGKVWCSVREHCHD
ncbi:hypothetical protein V3C99_015853 [Haemonchus contortus]|uniref:Leucine-rich repeat and Immunoglobulin I-set and Haem peroxidase domain containing protein n=1 Tax=Haemonchus contortus TaxID=6289 RepID=W6NCZ0_HAECO